MSNKYISCSALTVVIGERRVTFYPLLIPQVRKHSEIYAQVQADKEATADRRDEIMMDTLYASAQRGSPTVTREEVGAVVDVENLNLLIAFAMGGSKEGPKEVTDVRPTNPQTGVTSTQQ